MLINKKAPNLAYIAACETLAFTNYFVLLTQVLSMYKPIFKIRDFFYYGH